MSTESPAGVLKMCDLYPTGDHPSATPAGWPFFAFIGRPETVRRFQRFQRVLVGAITCNPERGVVITCNYV